MFLPFSASASVQKPGLNAAKINTIACIVKLPCRVVPTLFFPL